MAVLEIPELEAAASAGTREVIKARNQRKSVRSRNMVGRAKAQHDVMRLAYARIDAVKTKAGLVAQQEVDDWQSKDLASESSTWMQRRNPRDPAQSEVSVAKAKLVHDQAALRLREDRRNRSMAL